MTTSLLAPPVDPTVEAATRRQFLTGLTAAGLLAGCGSPATRDVDEATASGFPRTIRHAGGDTELTTPPTRVVALDTAGITDPLLALGVTPVGAVTYNEADLDRFPPALDGLTDTIESVGANGEPNLEAVAVLGPDLLLGYEYSFAESTDLARQIAPIVVVDDDASWEEVFDLTATILGREPERDAMLAQVAEAVERLRGVAAGRRMQIVEPRGDGGFVLYDSRYPSAVMLERAGVVVEPAPEGGDDSFGSGFVPVSDELLGGLTAQDLIVLTYNLEPEQRPRPYAGNPLWEGLPAVQAGRVHVVQGLAWTNFGPLGILRCLDEATTALRS